MDGDRAAGGRIPSLDGLRGIAAIAVMGFHFDYYFLPQAALTRLLPGLGRAYLGVDLFFLLSGFVIMHVYGQAMASNRRRHWPEFAAMRFARIYPLFALSTLLMVIIHALTALPIPNVSLSHATLTLQPFLLQAWADGLTWNYPAWSISTEAMAYVAFVFCAHGLLRGSHPRAVAAVCIGILAAVTWANSGRLNVFSGYQCALRTLAEFSLGALLYRVYAADRQLSGRALGAMSVALMALAALTRWDLFIVGAFACLIHHATDARTGLARLLDSRVTMTLGTWSYSIYLLHAPVHYAVMAVMSATGHPVDGLDQTSARLLAFATMAAVVALAAVTFTYYEVPMRRLVQRLSLSTPRWGVRVMRGADLP